MPLTYNGPFRVLVAPSAVVLLEPRPRSFHPRCTAEAATGSYHAAAQAPSACARAPHGHPLPDPVGLAAGWQERRVHDALAALGFGFIEIGTVTPRPQPGNPRPRLFRLPAARAVINRLGFNNHGVDRLVENVRRAAYRGVLGINIGKNADTPLARAADDYVDCLRKVYPVASYVTVNISSPNTQGLRDLHRRRAHPTASAAKHEHATLPSASGRLVPMAVKIAPDIDARRSRIAGALQHNAIAASATNTTRRDAGSAAARREAAEQGAPLTARSKTGTGNWRRRYTARPGNRRRRHHDGQRAAGKNRGRAHCPAYPGRYRDRNLTTAWKIVSST